MKRGGGILLVVATSCCSAPPTPSDTAREDSAVELEAVQPELFAAPGAQPNAWADFDNDGDLDLYVGFRNGPNRLYRNEGGRFEDVAAGVGLDVEEDTRVAAWGDFDADGDLDLYLGFPFQEGRRNRLYRNDGDGASFTEVASESGVALSGTTRQTSWIDYDNDGDSDLFVAFRDRPNRLLRNEGGRFADVTEASGIGDPRRTVGVVWFDMDEDGDLDLFVANQNGDADGFYRNDGGIFEDIARELGMDGGKRTEEIGGVGTAVTDFDGDGDLDLFLAMYGPDVLWRNEGEGGFTEVPAGPVNGDYHSTSAAWGDVDNDGFPDLFVVSYLRDVAEVPDHLFRNEAGSGRFLDVTPPLVLERGGSHGVQWADFDGDGDLDLALANNHPDGGHPLYRNLLAGERAARSLQVQVVDAAGRHTRAGSEVRIYRPGTRDVLGARLVDTGGGYCSQNVMPVHFGLPDGVTRVDVEVTTFGPEGRRLTSVQNVETGAGRVLTVFEGREPSIGDRN